MPDKTRVQDALWDGWHVLFVRYCFRERKLCRGIIGTSALLTAFFLL